MKLRLGESIKYVALLAIGFGVARWAWLDQARRNPLVLSFDGGAPHPSARQWIWLFILYHVRPALGGVALVLGLSVCVDRASRRPPRAWGVGRWAMGTWLFALVFTFSNLILVNAVHRYRISWKPLTANDVMADLVTVIVSGVHTTPVLGFLAAWFAARLAGWPRDPSPDLAEWIGRIVLLLIVLSTVIYDPFVG